MCEYNTISHDTRTQKVFGSVHKQENKQSTVYCPGRGNLKCKWPTVGESAIIILIGEQAFVYTFFFLNPL